MEDHGFAPCRLGPREELNVLLRVPENVELREGCRVDYLRKSEVFPWWHE
jgi:hypothetical protein